MSVFGLSTRVTRVTRVTSRTARVVLVRMRRRLDLLDYSNPHLTTGNTDGGKITTSVNFHKKAMSNV